MFGTAARFRELLKRDGIVVAPNVYDRFTARIAEEVGFEAVNIGGYVLGGVTVTPEPLLTLTDVVDASRRIQAAVAIPVFVDVGAGFGEAIQVWNMVREMEATGVCGVHLEDQVYPKRAHYHRDYREHVIETSHMIEKIEAALEARRDRDFVICVRTDAFRTNGYAEGIRRANAYARAGADMILMFPNNVEELRRAPNEIAAPVCTVISHGNRIERPILSVPELAEAGYKAVTYSAASLIAAYDAVRSTFESLQRTGDAGLSKERAIAARKSIEDLIGLPKLYEIEERTTERQG